MNGYSWIYRLKVGHEVEPGWYKLKWWPIKNGTWNAYFDRPRKGSRWHKYNVGVKVWDVGAHNGWGRSWSGRTVRIGIGFVCFEFWILWNIKCMGKGPQDVREADKRSLDIKTGPGA